ncbi:MAG: phage holin family protein [Verrucomicrobiota bacterium]|jgi:putative membrane protein
MTLQQSTAVRSFLERWAITTVAVLVAANIVRGIRYDSFAGVLVASLLLGVLNAFLRPVLMLISLPLLVFSLGLFTLFINAALFYLVGQVVKSFHVATFWSAFWGALIVSFVSLIASFMLGVGGHRVQFRRFRRRPPPPSSGDGGGPVIDV